MAWNSYSKVGLAQSVVYAPAFLAAAYLFFRKHGRPRMGWYALTLFSAVRIAGGIVLILFEDHPQSVAYIITALVFQGTGVIPLLLSTLGLLRVVNRIDFPDSTWFANYMKILRAVFFIAIVTVIAGSCLVGNYKDASSTKIGSQLAKAGYLLLIFVLIGMAVVDLCLWIRCRERLSSRTGRVLVLATTASMPLLATRITYSCLSIFSSNLNSKWSPLDGSLAALVLMHSTMEYIVVLVYLATGFYIPATRECKKVASTPASSV